jgi:hypothetical protein
MLRTRNHAIEIASESPRPRVAELGRVARLVDPGKR